MNNSFFQQPTLVLAKQLLGMEIVHEMSQGVVSGKIVEVEAYKGPEDKAAHSYNNRYTERTKIMYGPPGIAYLFRIYGMHVCFNIVTGPPNKPEAVLVRAIEPVQGVELMMKHRNIYPTKTTHGTWRLSQFKQLTNGPGKLCKALGISMDLYGHNLTEPPLYLKKADESESYQIRTGPRIRIDYAEEAIHYPWRFWIADNPFVSK